MVACYATLNPALSVRPSVRRSVHHTSLFWRLWGFWLDRSCPNAPLTSNMAPAHLHATGVAVYPALFCFVLSFVFIQQCIRLRLNNAGPDDSVVIGIWYSNPQRLDIHYKGEYVPALNMEKNAKGKYDSKPGVFMPTTNMPLGKYRKSFTNLSPTSLFPV